LRIEARPSFEFLVEAALGLLRLPCLCSSRKRAATSFAQFSLR
jgi:hypothetical protein